MINKKYGKIINKFSDEKLNKIYAKINDKIKQIEENSKLSSFKKERLLNIL
jgi:hypothetical protein